MFYYVTLTLIPTNEFERNGTMNIQTRNCGLPTRLIAASQCCLYYTFNWQNICCYWFWVCLIVFIFKPFVDINGFHEHKQRLTHFFFHFFSLVHKCDHRRSDERQRRKKRGEHEHIFCNCLFIWQFILYFYGGENDIDCMKIAKYGEGKAWNYMCLPFSSKQNTQIFFVFFL